MDRIIDKEVLALLKETEAETVASACEIAIKHIVSGSRGNSSEFKKPTGSGKSELVDASLRLFTDAIHRSLTVPQFEEDFSVAAPAVCSDVRDAICSTWRQQRATLLALGSDLSQGMRLSQLTGVRWALRHQLGDQTSASEFASRSIPSFEFTMNATAGDVTFRLTAEKAQDFLHQIRDAVSAAERISAGAAA